MGSIRFKLFKLHCAVEGDIGLRVSSNTHEDGPKLVEEMSYIDLKQKP